MTETRIKVLSLPYPGAPLWTWACARHRVPVCFGPYLTPGSAADAGRRHLRESHGVRP